MNRLKYWSFKISWISCLKNNCLLDLAGLVWSISRVCHLRRAHDTYNLKLWAWSPTSLYTSEICSAQTGSLPICCAEFSFELDQWRVSNFLTTFWADIFCTSWLQKDSLSIVMLLVFHGLFIFFPMLYVWSLGTSLDISHYCPFQIWLLFYYQC